ncbi:signal transduction histidine kinase [Aneurinibacillus soli]|uniref:histidine kinase n=1 Tax=Aneurinibacillus soli TaxID=1500254 RepID=A0A0U5BA46_9BACL|nr:HAMP domain-containing sensor histidine kinase [Aneurinibacillus soli]PYE62517.1 signal transduction histidine kinase [Aneurinibacillus soli]BAU27079.1 Signal transduction histidine-protein kinase ArlS [Aneurinibacillus soli]
MYKKWTPRSLTSRLAFLFTIAMVFFLLIMNLFVYWATMQLVYRHQHQLLQSKADVITNEISEDLSTHSKLNQVHLRQMLSKFVNEYQAVSLFTGDGTEIITIRGPRWRPESISDIAKVFEPESYFIIQMRAFREDRTFSVPGFAKPLRLEMLEDAKPLNHFIRTLLLILGTASVGAIMISGVGGYVLSRLGLRPLNRLMTEIYEMKAASLSPRLSLQSTAQEITALTDAFNGLLDRIEAALAKQKQFVSDASHELRTPLTIIDGYLRLLDRWGKDEVEIREEAIQAMKQECGRLFHLVDDLLLLAKLEEGTASAEILEVQDLEPLLEEVQQAWSSAFPAHLKLVCEWEDSLVIAMDREKFRRLLDIFLDNARKYTDEGEVRLKAYKQENQVHIIVEDTGIGIDEKEIPFLFERFYRVDKSRNRQKGGSGLGLAIAKTIIEMHRGEVTVCRTDQGGTAIHIVLPSYG